MARSGEAMSSSRSTRSASQAGRRGPPVAAVRGSSRAIPREQGCRSPSCSASWTAKTWTASLKRSPSSSGGGSQVPGCRTISGPAPRNPTSTTDGRRAPAFASVVANPDHRAEQACVDDSLTRQRNRPFRNADFSSQAARCSACTLAALRAQAARTRVDPGADRGPGKLSVLAHHATRGRTFCLSPGERESHAACARSPKSAA
jgi:hypothetical protein